MLLTDWLTILPERLRLSWRRRVGRQRRRSVPCIPVAAEVLEARELLSAVLNGVAPNSSSVAGGTSVLLVGSGFDEVTGVMFGDVAAESWSIDSTSSITVTAPPHTAGIVNILLVTASGTSEPNAEHGFFSYFATKPEVTGVGPASGSTTGGTVVEIYGTGFDNVTAVAFGGSLATSFTVNSLNSITAISPQHAAGSVDVMVISAAGSSDADPARDAFTYEVTGPAVASVSPDNGTGTGGTEVTILGSGFENVSDVSFGDTPAASFTVVSGTKITAIAPSHLPGAVDVSVTTPLGTSPLGGTAKFIYTAPVLPPTVNEVVTNSGTEDGGTSVTILGSNFTNVMEVSFGGVAATSFTVNSATSVTAVSPVHAIGLVDIVVTNSAGVSMTSPQDQFTFVSNDPVITQLDRSQGWTDGGNTITITGSNFTGVSAVLFGDSPAASYRLNSPTSLTVVTPAHSAGIVDIVVQTANGTSPISVAARFTFVVPPPRISANNRSSLVADNEGQGVLLTGTHLEGTTDVFLDGQPVPSFEVLSPTLLRVSLPSHDAGEAMLSVITPGGGASVALMFLGAPPDPSNPSPGLTAPVANDAAVTTVENAVTTFTLTGSDPGGAAIAYIVADAPEHGTISINGSLATYTPEAGYTGEDSFSVVADNGLEQSAAAEINIQVADVPAQLPPDLFDGADPSSWSGGSTEPGNSSDEPSPAEDAANSFDGNVVYYASAFSSAPSSGDGTDETSDSAGTPWVSYSSNAAYESSSDGSSSMSDSGTSTYSIETSYVTGDGGTVTYRVIDTYTFSVTASYNADGTSTRSEQNTSTYDRLITYTATDGSGYSIHEIGTSSYHFQETISANSVTQTTAASGTSSYNNRRKGSLGTWSYDDVDSGNSSFNSQSSYSVSFQEYGVSIVSSYSNSNSGSDNYSHVRKGADSSGISYPDGSTVSTSTTFSDRVTGNNSWQNSSQGNSTQNLDGTYSSFASWSDMGSGREDYTSVNGMTSIVGTPGAYGGSTIRRDNGQASQTGYVTYAFTDTGSWSTNFDGSSTSTGQNSGTVSGRDTTIVGNSGGTDQTINSANADSSLVSNQYSSQVNSVTEWSVTTSGNIPSGGGYGNGSQAALSSTYTETSSGQTTFNYSSGVTARLVATGYYGAVTQIDVTATSTAGGTAEGNSTLQVSMSIPAGGGSASTSIAVSGSSSGTETATEQGTVGVQVGGLVAPGAGANRTEDLFLTSTSTTTQSATFSGTGTENVFETGMTGSSQSSGQSSYSNEYSWRITDGLEAELTETTDSGLVTREHVTSNLINIGGGNSTSNRSGTSSESYSSSSPDVVSLNSETFSENAAGYSNLASNDTITFTQFGSLGAGATIDASDVTTISAQSGGQYSQQASGTRISGSSGIGGSETLTVTAGNTLQQEVRRVVQSTLNIPVTDGPTTTLVYNDNRTDTAAGQTQQSYNSTFQGADGGSASIGYAASVSTANSFTETGEVKLTIEGPLDSNGSGTIDFEKKLTLNASGTSQSSDSVQGQALLTATSNSDSNTETSSYSSQSNVIQTDVSESLLQMGAQGELGPGVSVSFNATIGGEAVGTTTVVAQSSGSETITRATTDTSPLAITAISGSSSESVTVTGQRTSNGMADGHLTLTANVSGNGSFTLSRDTLSQVSQSRQETLTASQQGSNSLSEGPTGIFSTSLQAGGTVSATDNESLSVTLTGVVLSNGDLVNGSIALTVMETGTGQYSASGSVAGTYGVGETIPATSSSQSSSGTSSMTITGSGSLTRTTLDEQGNPVTLTFSDDASATATCTESGNGTDPPTITNSVTGTAPSAALLDEVFADVAFIGGLAQQSVDAANAAANTEESADSPNCDGTGGTTEYSGTTPPNAPPGTVVVGGNYIVVTGKWSQWVATHASLFAEGVDPSRVGALIEILKNGARIQQEIESVESKIAEKKAALNSPQYADPKEKRIVQGEIAALQARLATLQQDYRNLEVIYAAEGFDGKYIQGYSNGSNDDGRIRNGGTNFSAAVQAYRTSLMRPKTVGPESTEGPLEFGIGFGAGAIFKKGVGAAVGAAMGGAAARKGIDDVVRNLGDDVTKWLGKDAKLIKNEFGDTIVESSDGLRQIRFDFNHTYPHKNPHIHLIEYKWIKNKKIEVSNRRLYPQGVTPE